ncbi:MAG: hypothetical protein ACOX8B_08510 [Lachnospiraceae bacterium]|jgi:hypothetical protein
MRKQTITAVMLVMAITAAGTLAASADETGTSQTAETSVPEETTETQDETQTIAWSDLQELIQPGTSLQETSAALAEYSGYTYTEDTDLTDDHGDTVTVDVTGYPDDSSTAVLTAQILSKSQDVYTSLLQEVDSAYTEKTDADGTVPAVIAGYSLFSGAVDDATVQAVKDDLSQMVSELTSETVEPDVTTEGNTETTLWNIPADTTLISDADLYSALADQAGADPFLYETVSLAKTAADDGTVTYEAAVEPSDAAVSAALYEEWKQSQAEETTAEEETTEESTTEEPTTGEETTAESTTGETTAEEAKTAEATTAEPTTEEATTAEVTTAEPTTEEATTAEVTTAEPTTEEMTTEEATTAETTTEEETTEEATTEAPLEVTEPQKRAAQIAKSLNDLLNSGVKNPTVSYTFEIKDQVTPEALGEQIFQTIRQTLQQLSPTDTFGEPGYVLKDNGSEYLYWYRNGAMDAVAVKLTPTLAADGVNAASVDVTLIEREYTAQNISEGAVPFGLQIGSTEAQLVSALGTSPYFTEGVTGANGEENETVHYVICLPWSSGNAYVTVDAAQQLYLQKMANDTRASYSTPAARLLTGYTLYLTRVSDPAEQRRQAGTAAQAVWGTTLVENTQDETWHQELSAQDFLGNSAILNTEFWAKWGSTLTPARTVDVMADPDDVTVTMITVSAQNQAALGTVISGWDVTDTVDVSELTVIYGTVQSVNGSNVTVQPYAAGAAAVTVVTDSTTIVTVGITAGSLSDISTGENVIVSCRQKSDGTLSAARMDIQE